MLKHLAYRIEHLGGGRKPPNLENWNYCSAGKTTLALSVSAKTQQKHRSHFIESWQESADSIPGWKERNSMGEDPPPHLKKHLGAG